MPFFPDKNGILYLELMSFHYPHSNFYLTISYSEQNLGFLLMIQWLNINQETLAKTTPLIYW